MPKHNQNNFKNTELNPELLSTPFRVQTNWHVITGGPSCGKTTLINLLTEKGFQTIPETARLVIQQEMNKEGQVHPYHTDAANLQRKIKDAQLSVEKGLQANDILFLDGAVPGSLAYYRVFGLNPNECLEDCFHHRYASVFMLDPLPFKLDDERIEDIAPAQGYLHEWHTRDFIALGYPVITVPAIPPEERLSFILDKLSELGLM